MTNSLSPPITASEYSVIVIEVSARTTNDVCADELIKPVDPGIPANSAFRSETPTLMFAGTVRFVNAIPFELVTANPVT